MYFHYEKNRNYFYKRRVSLAKMKSRPYKKIYNFFNKFKKVTFIDFYIRSGKSLIGNYRI